MKRSNPNSAPYLSWTLITRNASETLERTLASLRARTPDAEIVIVDTMSCEVCASSRKALEREGKLPPGEPLPAGSHAKHVNGSEYLSATVEIARRYADVLTSFRGPEGAWNEEMYAFDDAAAARNEALRLATGRWVGWIDADDELASPEEAERLLKMNARWRPAGTRDGVKSSDELPTPTLEDYLRHIEQNTSFQFVSAPYLYDSDENGLAKMWQDRERIVLKHDKAGVQQFTWREPAHEVLVPSDPEKGLAMTPLLLPQLLFVHLKRQTLEEQIYSAVRHYRIMRTSFERGRRAPRDLLYMANLCRPIEPQREEEYLHLAHLHSSSDRDRTRALVALGNLSSERGLRADAREAYGAAVQFRPDLPDAWLAGALAAAEALDWPLAVTWYREALRRKVNSDSMVIPRDHELGTPTRLAQALHELAKSQLAQGWHQGALDLLDEATGLAELVMNNPAVASDYEEARSYWKVIKNARDGQKVAMDLHATAQILIGNDETLKARDIIATFPHHLEDHPLKVALERWAEPLERHVTDPAAYAGFYAGLKEDTQIDGGDAMHLAPMARAQMLIDWCKGRTRTPIDWSLDVLEIGPNDGNIGVPLLRACSQVRYTGIEANALVMERFKRYVRKLVLDGESRLTLINASIDVCDPRSVPVRGRFDAVVLFEVIEHVPDPVAAVRTLLDLLRPEGRLFLSTPCGAFDKGHPEPHASGPRDPRGHVRAMTTRDLVDCVRAAGGEVEHLRNAWGPYHIGDTQQAIVRKRTTAGSMSLATVSPDIASAHATSSENNVTGPRPVTFAVPSALWDWNASHVEATGIGASEETIVYLARELARDTLNRVEVYGPVPEAEVSAGVAYWPREQARKIPTGGKVVVSRAPGYSKFLEHQNHALASEGMVLWLQDAWYPDLNVETAKRYDTIVTLSEWHKQAMIERCKIPGDNVEVIPNFLLREQFAGVGMVIPGVMPERKPHRFIYASSPDRGLVPLLKLWPRVLAMWPDAELHIFYGWDGCKRLSSQPGWTERYMALRADYDKLRWQKGVVDHGRVNHREIARQMMMSDLWGYVTDFEETFCSNALKARAAGCVPVCPPLAALDESASCVQTQWIEPWRPGAENDTACVAAFLAACECASMTSTDERLAMSERAIGEYDLATGTRGILGAWRKLLCP